MHIFFPKVDIFTQSGLLNMPIIIIKCKIMSGCHQLNKTSTRVLSSMQACYSNEEVKSVVYSIQYLVCSMHSISFLRAKPFLSGGGSDITHWEHSFMDLLCKYKPVCWKHLFVYFPRSCFLYKPKTATMFVVCNKYFFLLFYIYTGLLKHSLLVYYLGLFTDLLFYTNMSADSIIVET